MIKFFLGELFYEWAKEANDKGDFFPVWGTCNGLKKVILVDLSFILFSSFELLTVLSSKDQSRLTDCDSQVSIALQKLIVALLHLNA